jgi:hypothetical protein
MALNLMPWGGTLDRALETQCNYVACPSDLYLHVKHQLYMPRWVSLLALFRSLESVILLYVLRTCKVHNSTFIMPRVRAANQRATPDRTASKCRNTATSPCPSSLTTTSTNYLKEGVKLHISRTHVCRPNQSLDSSAACPTKTKTISRTRESSSNLCYAYGCS